jgi:hypothetical protein
MSLVRMRASSWLSLLLLLCLAIPAAAQVAVPPPPPPPPPPGAGAKVNTGTASIKGRVVAADTGRPLRRAQVRVAAPELGGMGKSAGTDPDGHFDIADLPAGRYTITVSRGGYLRMQYGQRRFGDSGAPLQVADGEVHDRIDFALPRASTISGRVLDESGQPVGAAAMYAMQWQYFSGRRQLVPIVGGIGTRSDDTGHYRLQGVPPGDYYVMATARDTWASDEDPDVTFGFSPSFYPGVAAPGEAQLVRVGVGQDVESIDFSLVPVRSATLSGIALGFDGAPLASTTVALSQEVRGPTSMSMSMVGSTRTSGDGSWKLERVLPGEYTLRVSAPGAEGRTESTTLPIFVSGTDIEGIVLAADPGLIVSGEVEADQGLALPAGSLRVVVSPLRPTSSSIALGADDGVVRDDGSFSRRTHSGESMINVSSLPPGWAVKTIEIDGDDYAGRPVGLEGGRPLSGVKIVLTDRFPTLTGALTDDRGNPAEGTVVLFPQDDARWIDGTGAVRTARPDQSGVYRFSAVRPGAYFIVALEYLPPGQVNDPEFLAKLQGDAERIRAQEGQAATLNLRVRR